MEKINQEIGKELKKLREAHKYTLEEIGTKIGKSRKTIHAYEKGSVSISVNTLKDILNIYNVNISKFLSNIEE